jgi:hypothetical protein
MCDVFRILTLQDYGKVAELFSRVFPETYKKEFDIVWMLRHTGLSLGAYVKGELAGFIITRDTRESLCIEFLGVCLTRQELGIGTMLLKHVLQLCNYPKITLVPLNDRVAQWYKKYGFQSIGYEINSFTGEKEEIMLRSHALPTS